MQAQPPTIKTPKVTLPELKGDFPLHKLLGVSPEVTRHEYLSLISQNDDRSNKLRALRPLLKDIGIDLESTEKSNNTQINIIMAQPKDPQAIKAEFEVIPPTSLEAKEEQEDEN